MRLVFSPYVESDLDEIAAYIAADNPVGAVSFIDDITAHLKVIAANPRLYRLRPEIGPEARLAAHGRYVILFRLLPDCVRIERVVHGARRLPDLFMREDADKGS